MRQLCPLRCRSNGVQHVTSLVVFKMADKDRRIGKTEKKIICVCRVEFGHVLLQS